MAEERVQRRLAAILAADVVGYSRLMNQDEVGTLATLKARRRDVLEPVVAKHKGRVFKVTGDGVLLEFGSAVNAVQCAVDLQHDMAGANTGQPDDRHIVLRIGVNLGDVMVEGGDLYGEGVNIAARLESMAEPGAILVSGTIYDYVKGKTNATFEDLGTQILKNIAEAMRVYRVAGTPRVSIATPAPATDKPSIAVLPFDNLSGDPAQQYFSDGITEDIITELSRFRSLFVIARNSSFQFRDSAIDVRRIGRELHVQYVVEGSVRKAGDRLRISVQLIDCATANHVWSERYDRGLVDVFAVQDEVVHAIVAMLAGQLSIAESEKSRRKRTAHLGAYDCYLRGLEHWRSPGPDADAKSNEWFERALALDPNYVDPLTTLCISEALLAPYSESDDRWDRPLAMATKAVTLDPNNSWSHCALRFVKLCSGRLAEASPHFDTAMRLNPNDPDQIMWCSNYHTYSGNFDIARDMIAEAERLNPLPPSWYGKGKAIAEYGLHHYSVACGLLEGLRNSLHYWEHCYLAACYVRLGKPPNAEREVAEALRLKPNLCIRELALVEPYARQDDLKHLLVPVQMAGLPE